MERDADDNVVPLTHEQLATLLGVGCSYASRVIQTFRGSILARNRDALQRAVLPLPRRTTSRKCHARFTPPRRP